MGITFKPKPKGLAVHPGGTGLMQAFAFENLGGVDLIVDATYRGGRTGHAGDDPFPRLLSVSNIVSDCLKTIISDQSSA